MSLSEFIEGAYTTLDDADVEFDALRELAEEMLSRLQDLHASLNDIVSALDQDDPEDALNAAQKALS